MTTQNKTLLNTKLKKASAAVMVAGLIGGLSLPVAANKYRDYNNSAFDYARVVDVNPVVETYQVNQPVEQCWDERASRRDYRNGNRNDRRYKNRKHSSRTPEVLGAIIGGALGNRFGHGDGRKIATVAGAVLGSSVGRDIKKNKRRHDNRYDRNGYDSVQRCELVDSYTTQERVVGYDVSYKYRGNVYHTQMGREPGDKIKVKVTVNPV
jgi:uncharacterized protein YcfJ